MSVFDPETFLENEYTGAMADRPVQIPSCESLANIDNIKPREVQTKTGPRVILDVFWELLDEELKDRLERAKIIVRQSLWLDFTDGGDLDYSGDKNWRLGQVRAALGQNTPGEPWSFGMLPGAGPALVHVKESEEEYPSEVDRVAEAPV